MLQPSSSPFRQTVNQFEDWLFFSPPLIFLPYLLIYLSGIAVNAPVETVRLIFILTHTALSGLFLDWIRRHRRAVSLVDLTFWIGMALFFAVPGVYLEYPSDAWEHLRRIFAWSGSDRLRENPLWYKFSYFWGYSLFSQAPPIQRRLCLDFYSLFWQWITAVQVYRLSVALGFSKRWTYVQTFAFFAFFGSSFFGYRYYALSSTPLAFISYLEWLRILLTTKKSSELKKLPWLLLIMIANHAQEVLFAGLSAVVVLGDAFFETMNPSQKKSFFYRLGIFLGIGFLGGILTFHFAPQLYQRLGEGQVSFFGGIRVWASRSRYLETWGIAGLIGLAAALFQLRENRRLALLTLAPVAVLFFPPTVMLMARFFSPDTPYRLLYAFPTSFILVALCQDLAFLFENSLPASLRTFGKWAALLILLSLSINPKFPWRGRLFFQLYPSPLVRSFKAQDQTAQWFYENAKPPGKCQFFSDDASLLVVNSLLGRPFALTDRLFPYRYTKWMKSVPSIAGMLKDYHLCGVLIPRLAEVPQPEYSFASFLSWHWRNEVADLRWLTDPEYAALAKELPQAGWSHYRVPPYYDYFEPPTPPSH